MSHKKLRDALTDEQIVAHLEAAGVGFLRFAGGLSGTKDIWTTEGSQDVRRIANGVRAILAQQAEDVGDVLRETFNAGYSECEKDIAICQKPPAGWRCTRAFGHEGPCAAVATDDEDFVKRGMDRLREGSEAQAKDVP